MNSLTREGKIFVLCLLAVIIALVFVYLSLFGAQQRGATELQQFTNPLPPKDGQIAIEGRGITLLKDEQFIKSELGLKIALGGTEIKPGAYKLSPGMSAWEIARVIKEGPYMKWVAIPEGLRKEQIVELLAKELGWNDDAKNKWVTTYTAMKYDETEGVYFPDTYLIPINEEPLKVADRLRAKFNEKFASYTEEALKQNIKWDTLLKLASVVQREAAGKDDMPLIAGILWNRLLKDMRLEVDATIQYINDSRQNYQGIQCAEITPCPNQELVYVGNTEKKWWAPIKPEDKNQTSSYNTYLNKGLPPHPIANPGIDAIKATLYSEETECLYYLHDESKNIHCAKTFEEHEANIASYLR